MGPMEEEDEAQTTAAPAAASGGGQRKAPAYPTPQRGAAGGPDVQRTFQPPPAPGGTPGQATPMPWGGMAPGVAGAGQGATPWANIAMRPQMPPAQPQAANPGAGVNQGQPQQPNWAALQQRFGGGQPPMQGQGSPRPLQPPMGQQGPQGNPWMQNLLQGAAGRIRGGFGGR